MHPSLFQCRGDLENHSVDAASTSEAVGFITLMQELKRKVRSWEQKVEVRQINSKQYDSIVMLQSSCVIASEAVTKVKKIGLPHPVVLYMEMVVIALSCNMGIRIWLKNLAHTIRYLWHIHSCRFNFEV